MYVFTEADIYLRDFVSVIYEYQIIEIQFYQLFLFAYFAYLLLLLAGMAVTSMEADSLCKAATEEAMVVAGSGCWTCGDVFGR